MEWCQVQQVPGNSSWRCYGMYGIWNEQCHLHHFRQLLRLSSEAYCSFLCLQIVRGTLCQATVSPNSRGIWREVDSFIYKWDGTKFAIFQSIPTRASLAFDSNLSLLFFTQDTQHRTEYAYNFRIIIKLSQNKMIWNDLFRRRFAATFVHI